MSSYILILKHITASAANIRFIYHMKERFSPKKTAQTIPPPTIAVIHTVANPMPAGKRAAKPVKNIPMHEAIPEVIPKIIVLRIAGFI